MPAILWIILAVVILTFALGFALAAFSMGIRRQTLDEARAWQEAHYDLSWYDALEKRDYTVKSYDGYALHAQLLVNPRPTQRYVVVSHGYTDNRFGALKYARAYLELGFNVIVYDLRGHGVNAKTHCTYSIRESRDLDALLRDCRERFPEAKILGIHGESLGAATSVAVLKYAPKIDFVVADCGFSEIESVMRAGLVRMRLPGALVHLASLCAKLRYGHFFHEMRPIDSLAGSRVPILFIHGEKDAFILPFHSEAMCRAAGEWGELRTIPGASHAASVLTAPDQYKACLEAFLTRIHVISAPL